MKNKRNLTLKRTGIIVLLLMISTLLVSTQSKAEDTDYDYCAWQEISFNCKHPILSDPLIRKALAHLADRETILEQYTLQNRANFLVPTFVNPSSYGFDSSIAFEYNPSYALQLIEQAGYSVEDLEFTIMSPNTNQLRIDWTEAFAENLRQVGITVNHVSVGWGEIIPRSVGHPALYDENPTTSVPAYSDGGYDMISIGITDQVNVDTIYQFGEDYFEENFYNFYQYHNEDYEDLVQIILDSGEGVADLSIYSAIQQIMTDDPPSIILFQGFYLANNHFASVTEGFDVLLEKILELEENGAISGGNAESLLGKLDAAIKKWEDGKDVQTVHHLDVFKKHVQVLLDQGSIPVLKAKYLMSLADLIISKILG
ncbi:MAG: ABC transporter substrate-binding protein [Candidatus Heimdallarchaeaceae archaeon]